MSTLKLGKVSPSGGMEMRDIVIGDLKTLNDEKVETTAVLGAPSVTTATAAATAAKVVTIQMKDAAGVNLAGRHFIRVWTAETAFGAPSTDNITSIVMSNGTGSVEVTEHAHYTYVTGANGVATATVTMTAAGTNHVVVAVGGKVSSLQIVKTE